GYELAQSPKSDQRFRRLFDAHESAMREYCSRRLGGYDANDATAEIFVVAWRRIDEVPTGDDARLWLYGVARNVVRNVSRSHNRRVRLGILTSSTPRTPVPAVEDVVIRRHEDRLVLQAMAKLSDDDQELLRLQLWEELSRAQIGEVLGISAEAVGSRLKRAKKRVTKHLKSVGLGPMGSSRHIAAEGKATNE
ncbi:MAG: sigma-70 family RNA polymerase sigma factor, partial [Acidimicrobiia bacterium]|nr:sigma-70 family RNA polymerase sigma factor [Acidimicrobiia bacterium]